MIEQVANLVADWALLSRFECTIINDSYEYISLHASMQLNALATEASLDFAGYGRLHVTFMHPPARF